MATAKLGPTRRRWPKILLVAGLLAAGLAWAFRAPIAGYTVTGASYAARVGCACRFVEGRDLKQCEADFEPGMELVSLSEDAEAKSVTASFPLLPGQTATWREGYGCVLEPWQD